MVDGECGAFLVWGDPTLYDSTIRIIEAIAKGGNHELDYEVIPGISSIQALAAKHKTTLNRIGQSIEITTGRRIAQEFPNNFDSVVVCSMLKTLASSSQTRTSISIGGPMSARLTRSWFPAS
jgi:precorrin-6A synthase